MGGGGGGGGKGPRLPLAPQGPVVQNQDILFIG